MKYLLSLFAATLLWAVSATACQATYPTASGGEVFSFVAPQAVVVQQPLVKERLAPQRLVQRQRVYFQPPPRFVQRVVVPRRTVTRSFRGPFGLFRRQVVTRF